MLPGIEQWDTKREKKAKKEETKGEQEEKEETATNEEEEEQQTGLVHLLRFYFERKIELKRPMVHFRRQPQRRSTSMLPVA